MSELLVLRRPRPPAIVPPLLSFTAGFIDSFTVLALFGLFVAQVTGSNLARFSPRIPAVAGDCLRFRKITIESLLCCACRLFPGVSDV
jgi:uncharacterized membrane protein YoaK (UPF0700 family)